MGRLALFTLTFCVAASVAFGQSLLGRSISPEERAKQEEQRKAERTAALPKMQSALKEIAGVELGQAESEALPEKGRGEWVSLQKPYRYFTKINPSYEYGRLVGVQLYFETGGKYSSKSLEAEVEATKKDVRTRLGMKPDGEQQPNRTGRLRPRLPNEMFNGWSIMVYCNSELQAIVLSIRDQTLANELRKADNDAKESKLATLPVFASGDAANVGTEESEKREAGEARIAAARKQEVDQRNAEREEQRKQLMAIQEELRRARAEQEVKKMVETGDMSSAIELCNRYKVEAETAKKSLDRLLLMQEKASDLSADALAVYNEKLEQARKAYGAATNNLAQIEGMLTPQKRAELEDKKRKEDEAKARKAKAEAEFSAFEKSFDK